MTRANRHEDLAVTREIGVQGSGGCHSSDSKIEVSSIVAITGYHHSPIVLYGKRARDVVTKTKPNFEFAVRRKTGVQLTRRGQSS